MNNSFLQLKSLKYEKLEFTDLMKMKCHKLESTHSFEIECKMLDKCFFIDLINYNGDDETYNKIRLFPGHLLKALKILNSAKNTFPDAVLHNKRGHAHDLEQFTMM